MLLFAETRDCLNENESIYLLPEPSAEELFQGVESAHPSIYLFCDRPQPDGRKAVMAVALMDDKDLPNGDPHPRPQSYVAWKRGAAARLQAYIEKRLPELGRALAHPGCGKPVDHAALGLRRNGQPLWRAALPWRHAHAACHTLAGAVSGPGRTSCCPVCWAAWSALPWLWAFPSVTITFSRSSGNARKASSRNRMARFRHSVRAWQPCTKVCVITVARCPHCQPINLKVCHAGVAWVGAPLQEKRIPRELRRSMVAHVHFFLPRCLGGFDKCRAEYPARAAHGRSCWLNGWQPHHAARVF